MNEIENELNPDRWTVYRSALIKSIRRGLVDDAIYWSAVLYRFGHAKAVWRRLLIHCSEDIGPAEPNLPANIRALYENYKDLVAWQQEGSSIIVFTHAVILMAKAKKSRIVDNAVICFHRKPLENRPVPDYAFDHHVKEGRELGRDVEFFFDESSKLHPCDEIDPYFEEARLTAIANKVII